MSLVAELGRRAGLPALRLDERGLCRMVFDGSLAVDLEHDEMAGALHVYSTLGPLPAQGREALYGEMLAANLFGEGTAGAALAVDTGRGEIVLCRQLALEGLGIDALVAALESFVDCAERWQARVASGETAPAPQASGVPDMPPGMSGMLRV